MGAWCHSSAHMLLVLGMFDSSSPCVQWNFLKPINWRSLGSNSTKLDFLETERTSNLRWLAKQPSDSSRRTRDIAWLDIVDIIFANVACSWKENYNLQDWCKSNRIECSQPSFSAKKAPCLSSTVSRCFGFWCCQIAVNLHMPFVWGLPR